MHINKNKIKKKTISKAYLSSEQREMAVVDAELSLRGAIVQVSQR
jgi:hypothetical protein